MSVNTYNEELERAREEISRLKEALASEKVKTEIASEYTDFGLWEYDIESEICFQFRKLKGKYDEYLEPIPHFYDTVKSWGIVHTEDMPEFKRFCDSMKAGEEKVSCDIRVINGDYELAWFRYEGRTVYNDEGKPVKVVGRTLDVTEEKGGVSENTTGKTDPLTDTYTVDVFRGIVSERRAGKNRYNGSALLYVGIDRFRDVMAHQGQEYTDYLQKTVAQLLKDFCNSERDAFISRVRGGEFLVYYSYNEINKVDDAARRIVSMLGDYVYNGEPVTCSVGISFFKAGKQPEDAYTEASQAFTEAEKSDGGRFMYYSAAMSENRSAGAVVTEYAVPENVAEVYDLMLRSFCNEHERIAAFRAALKAAGKYLNVARVFVYIWAERSSKHFMTYSADDRPEEESPCVEVSCTPKKMAEIFGDNNSLCIIGNENAPEGISLKNGAVYAELRAVRRNDRIARMFAIIFDKPVELSEPERHLIDVLGYSLKAMYKEYSDSVDRQQKRSFNAAIIGDHRIDGFSIIPGQFIIDYVGSNAMEHYGVSKGDICYKKIYGRDKPCEGCPAIMLAGSGESYASAALYNESERRWLDVTASAGETRHGEKRYVISSTDITDCLGKVSMTDQLTGLMTFNVFISEALRITTDKPLNGLHRFAVVINVAEFNRLNEEKGFETGNSILMSIADIVSPCVGEGELVCRSEDSRFVLMLCNESDVQLSGRLSILLSSIQKQVYEKFGVTIYLLAGICDMTEASISVMSAIDRAIIAQKTVRNLTYYRENLMVVHDKAMREKIRERRTIEENMYTALDNNEFRVYYQPKVNIGTGNVVGAEALVRWIRPNGEVISPGRFIPIFEENGFITEMDFAIYRGAVTDMAKWLREGIDIPLISLNVSRRHLVDEDFCVRFNSLVDDIGVPHEYIELEITESLLTENVDKLIAMATWFKDRGYRISIDDFGSGYSSLNLITMLPFDTLKIDGGFFLKNDLTEKNKKVITSVVTLAKSLNLTTVSEGVETQGQVDFLRDLGCDMVQGFFYYKPMPSSDFHELILPQKKQ